MKAFRVMVLSFVLIFCLIIGIGISKAEAFTYYGEFRWELTPDVHPDEAGIMSLGVADMGGGHFILSGREEGCDCPTHGSGYISGSNIILILHDAGIDEGELYSGTFLVTLSLNILDGTYRIIDTSVKAQEDSTGLPNYSSGKVKFLGPK